MSCRSPRRSAPSTSTANCGRRRSGASGESPPSVATAERLPASTARPGPCRVAAMPLPQGLGRFNRLVTNPVTRTFAGRVPGFAIVVHRGRTSGRRYRTPVNAFARPDGGYTLALTGRRVELANPRVVHDPSRRPVPPPVRAVLALLRVEYFLELDRAAGRRPR